LKFILNKLTSQAALSSIFKGLTGFFMFISISLLVRYLGETGYGIWVLIFSFFQWGLYFDFGISNVLKSKIPELLSKRREDLISDFISESLKITAVIALLLLLAFCVFIFGFNLNETLNINLDQGFTQKLFFLNAFFFCINFILSINKALYIGVLNPKISELSATVTQIFFFGTIIIVFFLFSSYSMPHKLLAITLLNGITTTLVNCFFCYFFFKKYVYKLALFKSINKSIAKEIFRNGTKFMIIQIFMVIIFFSDPYFIAAYGVPKEVSIFDIINRLYQLPLLVIVSGLASYWPFFAQKYHNREFVWFKVSFKKFEKTMLLLLLGLIAYTFASCYIIPFWIGTKVGASIDAKLLIVMMFIVFFRVYFTFYANFFNAINRLKSQIVIMGITATIKIPFTLFILKNGFGLNGIFLQLLFFMLIWAVYFRIESSIVINKMINEQ